MSNDTIYPILHTSATSLETAQEAKNYPYGRLRTSMFYFVEHRPKMGYRPVTQSINPKNDRLNKPHPGTYWPMPVYVVETKEGFFDFVFVPQYPGMAQDFISKYWNQVPETTKAQLEKYWKHEIKSYPTSCSNVILNFEV